MVNKIFAKQIGRNKECFVEDLMVKSFFRDHAEDFREYFEMLRKNNMRINPSKYTFEMASGNFLGYMVSARGIKTNPEKI